MAKKVISEKIIESCACCPKIGRGVANWFCGILGNTITNVTTIPSWCPLGDYKEPQWLDKPDGEGWWDYWLLYTKGMKKEFVGLYEYCGRYIVSKRADSLIAQRGYNEYPIGISLFNKGKWTKATIPELPKEG